MISAKDKWMIGALMVAGFLNSLSQSLLTSALPSIMETFNVDAGIGQWLTTVHILVLGVITAVSAYVFYRFPTKALVQTSLAIFVGGCLIALFAPTFPVLLVSRVIQACGAGVLIPVLQYVVLYLFPADRQGLALGLVGIGVGFAPAVGPVLSGILVDVVGWRGIFVFLIIASIIVLVINHFVLHDVGERKIDPLDFFSLLLYGIGFTAFMLGVTWMKNGTILRLDILCLFVLGITALYVFTRRQLASKTPLLKLSLLSHRPLVIAVIVIGLFYILMMADTILFPIYIQTICGKRATLSGLVLLPGSMLIAVFSPLVGKIMDKHGARILIILGILCLILGNGLFFLFADRTSIPWTTVFYGIHGLGLTLLITTGPAYGILRLPLAHKPHGTAIINSLRQMTGSLFSTILVIIASAVSHSATLSLAGIRAAVLVMVLLASAVLILALFTVKDAKMPQES